MLPLSSQQLKSIVEEKWESDPSAVAFGLHVSSPWNGSGEIEFDFGTAQVLRADNVFRVREILREAESKGHRVILLTSLQQSDLGQDVVARLARIRVFHVDHIASLCGLFKAKELDPSICVPEIADALVEYSPRDGYPPVSAGVLDAATTWRAVCRHVFEMGDQEPDLVSLLLWATTQTGPQRYIEATDELRNRLHDRLVTSLGQTADAILRIVDNKAGADTVALAVACQVVFGSVTDDVLETSAARLEQFHGNKTISTATGRALGELAIDAVADLEKKNDDPRIVQQHLTRADELLKQLRCEEHAYRSSLSPKAYAQRLARFGQAITSTVDAPTEQAIATCEQLQWKIASHRLATQRRYVEQASRTEMAVRLVRWLRHPVPEVVSFSELAASYIKEVAFVDWAREAICRGEDQGELSSAYLRLDAAIAQRQSAFGKAFANRLADWVSVGSKDSGAFGVEDVVEEVVARVVAAKNRVLVIVLDGMSWAVCHELLEDIRQDHWFEATLDEGFAVPQPVIATVPSETKFSRTSLLSGDLVTGDASSERRNFAAHAVLVHCSDKRYPPILFHKKDITEGSRGTVSEELSKAILSSSQHVVGVVINAIDDRLNNAQQVRDNWTVNRISPLGALLRLARDAGRVVILASDHGHVWHRANAEHERQPKEAVGGTTRATVRTERSSFRASACWPPTAMAV